MSKQATRRPSSAKRRPQARKGRTAVAAAAKRGGRRDLTTWIVAGVIIAIGGAFLFAVASGKKDTTGGTGATPASAALVSKITSVPPSVFSQVGTGAITGGLPTKLPGPPLTANGKPLVVYIGAEYCPYCATERWAMAAAFSRFGTFKNLKQSTSSSIDVFPSTQTLSFYKSTYTSKYLEFQPVEQYTNIQKGGSPSGYSSLDKITAAQQALLAKFDAPPYVSASSAGAIPFIDFGNQWLISGATYNPQVLQGKSADEIAGSLADPSTDISKGAIGAANAITAAICKITKDQPASVCAGQSIQTIEAKLK